MFKKINEVEQSFVQTVLFVEANEIALMQIEQVN